MKPNPKTTTEYFEEIPSNKRIHKIETYRKRFEFSETEFSDEEVWQFILHIRWLARLYINEYKHLSPKDILKQIELMYNKSADKLHKDTLGS
ncbi:MAG: hypothetical protein ACE5DX_03705 [Candidatus Dojkabacteria bacterium]